MADYYPLIARAIAGLDPSAPGESRRALYERARAALIAQLRSVQPPLSESEITRERLSLEEAVRKVESEAAQRARDASRAGGDRARSGDAFRANTRPNARPGETAPPSTSQASRRCAAAAAAVSAASPDAGPATAADPRTCGRGAPGPRQQRPASAGRARVPRHRRRRRRSWPRRRPGQSRRAEDLCQRAFAVAGVRPARAEHGGPRRRSE